MPHLRDSDMTLPMHPLSLRTTNLNMPSDMECDSHSSSAYPASSTSSDSEVETPMSPNSASLQSSISSLRDFELRAILVKLAEESTHFQHAIMKEVSQFRRYSADTHTPTRSSRTRKSKTRSKSHRNLKNLSVTTKSQQASTAEVVYHPGNLEEETYEFLSRSSDEVAFKVVRQITMWSCCDEDELSPGCMTTPSPTIDSFVHHRSQKRHSTHSSQETDPEPCRGRSPTAHSHIPVQARRSENLLDNSAIEPVTTREQYYYRKAQRYGHARDWNSN